MKKFVNQNGSTELIVLGLLAALIVVLAIPLLSDIGSGLNKQLVNVNANIQPHDNSNSNSN